MNTAPLGTKQESWTTALGLQAQEEASGQLGGRSLALPPLPQWCAAGGLVLGRLQGNMPQTALEMGSLAQPSPTEQTFAECLPCARQGGEAGNTAVNEKKKYYNPWGAYIFLGELRGRGEKIC